MYIEKSLKEALSDYLMGRPVRVMWEKEDGSLDIARLSDLLEQEENRFLVDVPAVINPEFEQAVQEMEQPSADQIVQAVHETQEEDDTPPNASQREEKPMMSKREEAAELSQKGMSMREISNELGISYNTVYGWLRKPKTGKTGDNVDRHLCVTCQYRAGSWRTNNAGMNCNYIGITGKKRPCKPENCTVYVKGARLKEKEDEDDK